MRLLIGEQVSVVTCTNPSVVGKNGKVLFESARMIHVESKGRLLKLPKNGMTLQVGRGGEVVVCGEIVGRLEERLVKGARH